MTMEMTIAAKCYLALGIDKRPQIVRSASHVVFKYVMEIHKFGEFAAARREIKRIADRFKLWDYVCALHANYPPR
jgi:hypothetical protein